MPVSLRFYAGLISEIKKISDSKLIWQDRLAKISNYKTNDHPKNNVKKINNLLKLQDDDKGELGKIGEATVGDFKIAKIVFETPCLVKKLKN